MFASEDASRNQQLPLLPAGLLVRHNALGDVNEVPLQARC